jgi:membrane protein implicated in regulation of membrane protease activity
VFVYAAVGGMGLLFLLAMLFMGDVFGGDHDFDSGGDLGHDGDFGSGPSFLSARIISAFITAFGVGGVVGRYYNLSHPASSGVGIVTGVFMAGLVYQFAKILYSQQASSELRMAGLKGMRGEVTVAIPQNGVGEIMLTAGGERTTHIARSADGQPIPAGVEIVVINPLGQSVVVSRAPAPASGVSS